MKLGEFDEKRAIGEAVSFLARSIFTLEKILGLDSSSIDESSENPYELNSAFYASFECLKSEVIAYNKIMSAEG
jgi:hypothetical protein